MSVMKSLWASVQGDPTFMRRVNGWFTIFWVVMIPISIILGLLSSVAYVSALSLWALVSGHWSAWQAARVEVAQQDEVQKLEEHPIEDRVVESLIENTDVNAHSAHLMANSHARGGDEICQRLDDLATQLRDIQQSLTSHSVS